MLCDSFSDILRAGPARKEEGDDEQFGAWSGLVRGIANHHYDRALAVFQWPLKDALLAFREVVHEQELTQYRFDYLIWTLRAPHVKKAENAPKVPLWMQAWSTPKVIRG